MQQSLVQTRLRLPIVRAAPLRRPVFLQRRRMQIAVQVDWLERAAQLPGKSLHVALAAWCSAAGTGSPHVVLGRLSLQRFNVSRDACFDAMDRLVEAKLIEVDRRRGRYPIVTLLGKSGQRIAP
jgi:hypothetical protein